MKRGNDIKVKFRRQWLLAVGILLLLGAATAYDLYVEYRRTEAVEHDRLKVQARVIDENLEQQLTVTYRSLERIRHDISSWRQGRDFQARANARLVAIEEAIPGLRTLLISDARGIILASNRRELIGRDVSGREYFLSARGNPDPGLLFLSRPFMTVLGVFAMDVTRVIFGPDGRFDGIVSATLDPAYFRTLLASVLYAPDMWVALAHGDGVQFMMVPDRQGQIGKNLDQPGSFFRRHRDSGRDVNIMKGTVYATGEERVMALRTVRPAGIRMDKPIVLAVGRDLHAMYEDWRLDSTIIGLVYAGICLCTIVLLRSYQKGARRSDEQAARFIEALRDSEEKYRQLFEAESDAIFLIDNETGRIYEVNSSAEKIYGYARSELLGMSNTDLSAEPEKTRQSMKECDTTIPIRWHRRKDGTVFPVEITASHLTWNGRPVHIAAIRDITERKRDTEALENKTRELEDLTRNLTQRVDEEIAIRLRSEQVLVQQSKLAAMGEMLGAIAHQWRQPLNALGLTVQNMRDAYDYGELDRDYLESIVQKSMAQIQHMSKTIDDFRNFFRPDKEKADFDTMRAVGDVLSLFSAELRANGIVYRLTCHTHGRTFDDEASIVSCPEKVVNGFRNEFEHVILNLVNNARDAIRESMDSGRMAAPGHGLIMFDFYSADRTIIIKVGDNGGGIPCGSIGRVFEPYFTTKDQSRGTGLGLYMSKIIIEDHMHGRLSAENSGQGAVFTLELPRSGGGASHA
ncbi:MAG: PAS domain S-box protein [Nitrospiraceae bacterium]|nr:PAS domain S-box protein [Nitrospiraceae bacterium]